VSSDGISTRTWVLIGEGAFTALAIGSGIFFLNDKSHAEEQIDLAQKHIDENAANPGSACSNPQAEPEGVQDACGQLTTLTDQRDRSKTLATVSFIGAGVGAVALVSTFLLWKPASSGSETGKLVRPRITPRVKVGAGSAFVGIGGAF
jgi:hypothetical protein